MSNTSSNKTSKTNKQTVKVIVGEIGRDTKTGILGRGYSYDNGATFHVTDTMFGRLYDKDDGERMWPNMAHKVADEIKSATADLPNVRKQADEAVKFAESAIVASKVNSDAIVAQSSAVVEAKSAMDSATAEIQQLKANAASDVAQIRADVAQVQNEVDTAKAANSASVDKLKSDIGLAKKDLDNVRDSLAKAQSAIEQNQKLINDSVAKITSDVSATKQDLADVHDSLTKAQAAAEENQKAIDKSITQINTNVDATNQDLAGVRKDLTKARSDITANQKAIDDNVAQISDDITQDRRDIADVRQCLTKAQSDITANQKVVNDNVAQINSNIEQDRKDIASAQQANANTAKQLDTYSKQAQEQERTIKAVQDKQDGFSIALADVQGNVAQVSDKVDGLSANLKDAQGNVASVKAQADQLSATLTDHGKAIATLTASAKELRSTLEDADGRLSKVEQTAQTNSSTLSDVQGDLSQVKQNATKLVSTLKDAQGNISTLQQKADSVSTQLASAQGDIATLQTGVDSVKATLTSHDKSIHTLQADSKSLKDSMADAQGDISTLSKTATDVTSELEDHTGRLSKVEQSAAKQATTLSDLQGNLSQVEQKADSNTATISSINKNAMQDRGVITDTKTSFDSLTQLGTYSIKASGLPKMPEQHYGTLVVSGSAGSGWLSQQFVADTTGNVYTRVFSNNAWSAWKQGGSQDAINQVKQTADSNSATIRNVQGDVSTLKQTAAGVEAALADHEGDIHTLQADDKSLKDSMADAQGDISTLSKTATSLDSEMKDHAGRLSKVEQNATTQATSLSDLQGNLTQVKQQADGLVTTLKDAQGNITQVQQKADGTLEQLKNAQGDIASLQTDVTGIKATLVSHEGDIHTLQADSKTLKDDMTDAQGNISSLQKSSTKLDSEMSSQDGRLSKVEQTAKEHTSTISDLGDKLNDKDGINLLKGTADFKPDNLWVCLTSWQKAADKYNGLIVYKTSVDWNGVAQYYPVKKGETYTFSLNARYESGSGQSSFYIVLNTDPENGYKAAGISDNSKLVNLDENWQRVSITFTVNSDGYIKPRMERTNNNKNVLEVCGFKLEHGSVATPWTPAPEDMATVTQVKQTADSITTTLRNVQGDVDQVTQKASGTSEQLADVKDDVTSIQKDVNGLKQTTADNAGNIHTLQSDSKSLHDSMQDVQGDISTLKKTSTDVTFELKDHAGRISKTEQTAATLTNEFADQQGHLSRVEQKSTGTEQTVANQQGQINTIKTDVSGIHETLTGQGNQIATINVTLNGLSSKYEGVSGDLGKLTDKVTANSTQITQNKQAIALKADQSTVNNLSGEVSQTQAQLKVQAGQISSKVSSTDFKTLNDKVNGIQVGGRNLITGTSSNWTKVTNNWGPNWALNPDEWKAGDTITISAEIRNGSQNIFIGFYNTVNGQTNTVPSNASIPAGNEGRLTFAYKLPEGTTVVRPTVFPGSGTGTFEYRKLKVEKGNVATDWAPAPEDLTTAIQKNSTAIDQTNQKISLKADQTEVDQIKNTATQNSSRLNVMADEISSKVTSTDVNNIVDSKGYATTSTVQSLITQKAGSINEQITNLTTEFNARDGINLLTGTKDFNGAWQTYDNGDHWHKENWVDPNGNYSLKSDSMVWNGYYQSKWLDVGTYTFSLFYYLEANYPTNEGLYIYCIPNGGDNLISASPGYSQSLDITPNKWNYAHFTFEVTKAGYSALRIESTQSAVLHISSYKLQRGSIATPWSPAPSDLATVTQLQSVTASIDGLQSRVTNYQNDTSSKYTQLSDLMQSKVGTADFDNLKRAVDMQTLDSADINNMKTNGHYFVHNLNNSPIAGWVYVDVTGNGNDRIRQDVYQDNGIQHKYRRWVDTHWTGWEEGATYTEITQLQDAVNLRVQKGELLSQINLTAGNTLIQSNKLYLDASSVVITGTAFIPSAAIASLGADKINTGTLNTDKISLSNGHVRLSSDDDHFYVQTEENAVDNPTTRFNFDGIDFLTNAIPNGYNSSVPYYSIGYDGASNGYLRISAFDHINPGGTTATQNWYTMVDAISLTNSEINFATKGNMHMQVVNGGVNIKPSLFFQNNTNNGTYAGFTRLDNSNTVEFNTGDNNGENFHVNSGARFMKYVYFNDYCRAQGWLTYSTLSKKTNIKKLDTSLALDKIRQDDQYLYEYKRNVAKGVYDPQASFIIDDVNDVSHYSVPREFIDQTGKYREPSVELSYLIAAFQEIDKQVQTQKEEIKELKEKLQHE